jgi:hypothetical protein
MTLETETDTEIPEIFQQQSILVADCGHTNTNVVLFDVVEGCYRLIARASVPTTAALPWLDISRGIQQAIQKIVDMTGRELIYDHGQLIMPMREDGTGIDLFATTVSAATPLSALLVGLFDDVSLASARQVLQTTYVREIDRFSLTDTRSEQERAAALHQLNPDLIFIVGGTDGGADSRLLELIEAVDLGIDIMEDPEKPHVVYAGNRNLQEKVKAIMEDNSQVYITNNVRPSLEVEDIAAAAQVVGELYEDLKIKSLPGIREVLDWSSFPVVPTARAFAASTQFLSALHDGRVVGVDVGSDSITFVASLGNETKVSVRTDLGMGRPLANLLQQVSPQNMMRWLPEETTETAVSNFILQKSLFPQTVATTEYELHMEQAIMRELIRLVAAEAAVSWGWAKRDWQQTGFMPPITTLVVRGSTFANTPRPGQVISMLLDALQPIGIYSIQLARYGVLPALGLAGAHESLIPVQALETGVLINLGWVIAPRGRAQPRQKVLDVIVESAQVRRLENEVMYGTLDVISLEPGQAARVTIQPYRRFDIGLGPGKGVTLNLQTGTAGLVIDARGRPMFLPEDDEARRSRIRQWMWDMGG